MTDLVPFLFHEKQEGQLCAQHALNNLLQGSYFTATDLAEIARELDAQELQALQQGDPSNAAALAATFTEGESNNYDDTGFFSVQVIQRALQVWDLTLLPIGSRSNEVAVAAKSLPHLQNAFILNLAEHWFTLRKFGGSSDRWYNLNSVHSVHVSQTYLGMLLQQMETEGYSIFVIDGSIPVCPADEAAALAPVPSKEALAKASEKRAPAADDGDAELKQAIAMSLGNDIPALGDQDDDLQKALKASMMDPGIDAESLAMAISASLADTGPPSAPTKTASGSTEVQQPTRTVSGPPAAQPAPQPVLSAEEIRLKRLQKFGQ
ncbi:Ataxin-3 [Kappamyces sp. JEL0829]|nr:Ataxin-3 [Kappamyces sp. JEL0829]